MRDVDGYQVAWKSKKLVDRMNIIRQTTADGDHEQTVSWCEDEVAWFWASLITGIHTV